MGRFWHWLLAHERAPEPYSGGRGSRIALLAVAALVLAYVVIGSLYVIGLQNAFGTKAEDLGIMDQTLWNTVHGNFMHQTICNPIGDSNCLGDVSRFAIHFEPILALLAPLYLIAPSVKTLMILQVIVVASGAFPAYLLAARRLRNPLWGVAFALLFLLHPALLMTAIDDFHPETLAATAMMWALYCLAVRRYRALIVLCVLLLLCKETFTLDVTMIGLFIALLHRRWRVGLPLVALGVATLGLALLVMHLASPIGHSPVDSRLHDLVSDPIHTLLQLGADPARRAYLFKLFVPVGFLPLLSPWALALAAPSILLNMTSGNPAMYSGLYQYNTDIVPVLLAASVDALVWLIPLFLRVVAWGRERMKRLGVPTLVVRGAMPALVLSLILLSVIAVTASGSMPRVTHALTLNTGWPTSTAHDRIGDKILDAIPASASVSAQATLVPHVSERRLMYQFPSQDMTADYVLLDVTASVYYPFETWDDYVSAAMQLLNSCQVSVAEAHDGYLLLRHVDAAAQPASSCDPELPQSFFTFAYASPPKSATPVAVDYADEVRLVAYSLNTKQLDQQDGDPLTVTTYWRALKPVSQPLTAVITLQRPDGTRYVTTSLLQQPWLPLEDWKPGSTIRMQTPPLYLADEDRGTLVLGVEVRAGSPEMTPPATASVPATIAQPVSSTTPSLPRLVNDGTSALLTRLQVK